MKIITVIKRPTDPITTRVSLGGEPRTGAYLTYRGKIEDVRELLEIALGAVNSLPSEPDIDYSEFEENNDLKN